MSTDPRSLHPGMRRSRELGWWDPGICTLNWGKWRSFSKTYFICIIAQVFENCFDTPLLAFCFRGRWWVAAECGDLWSEALHTTHYYHIYQYFCIQWHQRTYMRLKKIQQVLLGFSSSLPINYICYQHTVVGKYCTLCLHIVWLLDGADWHEAPWIPGLCTSWLWSGHWIWLAFSNTALIQIYILGTRLVPLQNKSYFNVIVSWCSNYGFKNPSPSGEEN